MTETDNILRSTTEETKPRRRLEDFLDIDDKNCIIYSDSEIPQIKDILLEEIPPHFNQYFNVELILGVPQSVEYATSIDGYYLEIDGRKYTQMTNEIPIETHEFQIGYRHRLAELINSDPFYEASVLLTKTDSLDVEQALEPAMAGNAGDALRTIIYKHKASPLDVIIFKIDAQIACMEELALDRHSAYRKKLEEITGSTDPTVTGGVGVGSLTMKYVELGHEEDNSPTAVRLLVMGSDALQAQDAGKEGWYRHPKTVTDTGTHWAVLKTLKSTLPAGSIISLSSEDTFSKKYIKAMKRAGLEVKEVTMPDGQVFYSIEFPTGENGGDIVAKLKDASFALKKTSESLRIVEDLDMSNEKETELETPQIKRLDVERLMRVAKYSPWPWAREENVEHPSYAESKEQRKKAQVAFYDIKCLGDLKKDLLLKTDEDQRLSSLVVLEAASYIAQEIARVNQETGWVCENLEADRFDTLKMLFWHNVLKFDPDRQGSVEQHPEIFESILKSMDAIKDPNFKKNLFDYIQEQFEKRKDKDHFHERFAKYSGVVQEAIEDLDITTTVGFVDCGFSGRDLSYYLMQDPSQDRNEWDSTVGGPPSSVVARACGFGANKRYLDFIDRLKEKQNPSEKEQKTLAMLQKLLPQLEAIDNRDLIIMHDETRQKLGIPDNEVIVVRGLALKGLSIADYVIYPLKTPKK